MRYLRKYTPRDNSKVPPGIVDDGLGVRRVSILLAVSMFLASSAWSLLDNITNTGKFIKHKVQKKFGRIAGENEEETCFVHRTNTDKRVTKVKGFTLHHQNCAKINGRALEQLIDRAVPSISVQNKQIIRNAQTKGFHNLTNTKTMTINIDKRVIGASFERVAI